MLNERNAVTYSRMWLRLVPFKEGGQRNEVSIQSRIPPDAMLVSGEVSGTGNGFATTGGPEVGDGW